MDRFDQGVLYSAAIIVFTADMPVVAADLLREAGLGKADCSTLDEFDKNLLRKVNGEKGIALTGL